MRKILKMRKEIDYKENILETVGNTPLVKLNKIAKDIPALVLIKMETFNPGHSTKDRMALKMLEDAERNGDIKPGGTIIECTSGNTGMGLALGATVKGYKCIFTTSDKQSQEKFDMLKALGAEVIVCPTNVSADDPRSYYSVAERLSKEIPNSFWFNQYDNLSNRQAHYESTGPEIWEQTKGQVTHVVVGVGTGGTISGVGKYLKEKNPNIKIWGIDTYGSVFKKYHETGIFDKKEIYPYITEGIGEDILPKNVDFDVIDYFEKVTDKDGAVMARRLAKEEGLFLGYSAGSAVAGLLQLKDQLTKDDVVVVIIHDHGSRYVGKLYNDEWMRERGFLDDEITVKDIIAHKPYTPILEVSEDESIGTTFSMMKEKDISQMPVTRNGEYIGSISEGAIINFLIENPKENADKPVSEIMGIPFPVVDESMPCKRLCNLLDEKPSAVLAKEKSGRMHVITKYDVVKVL